ncbi:MAG: anthranilate synthase component I family protein [Chitinophagaceae bacterium]|jgi:para-aminobenzoate synthetase component 1
MLHWANQCNILLFLDSNQYTHTNGAYECLCGAGGLTEVRNDNNQLSGLKENFMQHKDWLFGHINYDFKNKLERLKSEYASHYEFDDIHFFQPETVCYILRNECEIHIESAFKNPEEIWHEIQQQPIEILAGNEPEISFQKRIEESEYLDIIGHLKDHIINGDCYEINFCNEAFSENVAINPLNAFHQLNRLSPAPFAAYYKSSGQHLMCASPERYLRKEDDRIIAQPIKGTAKRSSDSLLDKELQYGLSNSIKERAENVMIVDLMRNDLARFCEVDSVTVEELFGIYTFPQVHQMISTISGKLKSEYSLFDAIRLSFPMGSMTGAPKIMVMKLIEQYEKARRELFSGCVGYISPDGNFDFNVIIRSLFYNQNSKYLGYQTGGAITFNSDPTQEWQETLLKAMALEKIFHT